MNAIRIILVLVGGVMFLAGAAAYVYVKIKLRPDEDSGLDEVYYEFEDQQPSLARYNHWSQVTFGAAVIGALLVFIAVSI